MSNFFIRRPIVAIVISILTVLIGLAVLSGLPIEQYPALAPPTMLVETPTKARPRRSSSSRSPRPSSSK